MTKKRILIILITAIVVVSVVISLFISPPNKTVLIKSPSSGSPFTKPATSQVRIGSPKGEITVPNFYENVINEKDGSAILEETQDYQISFVISENRFYIDLLNPDLAVTIPKAENALLSRLKLDEEEACKLDVKVRTNSVFIPGPVVPINLSFCK